MGIGEKLVSRLSSPIVTSKGSVSIGASIGISVYPEEAIEASRLLEIADEYMYTNKRARKQGIAVKDDVAYSSRAIWI